MNALNVYVIGKGTTTPEATAELVGSKAYHLMRMERLRLPVPPAFVLSTAFSHLYFKAGGRMAPDFPERLRGHMRTLESQTGKTFGGRRKPLLVSVRSGAPVSMPGMMETILNIGLTHESVLGLKRMTGNPRLAWDAYRRLVQEFAEVVYSVSSEAFDSTLASYMDKAGIDSAQELDTAALRELTGHNLDCFSRLTGKPFPQDPQEQLRLAVEAVFRSWESPRARAYRHANGIDDAMGTAVTVQAMVFGNAGGTSGAGVGFTRDPASGEPGLYLDFAFNAQGEDVVSGRRTVTLGLSLPKVLPETYAELVRVAGLLEREFRDLQDFEFTVEEGCLYLLQTRAGKRTPWAALRIAVDMVREGLIDPETALERLADYDLNALQRTRLRTHGESALARATSASLGVAAGRVALTSTRARELAESGEPAILVRADIATEDVVGMASAVGILAAHGARTSHAAVVARHMGKVCLVGCQGLVIEPGRSLIKLGGRVIHEGGWLSLDGDTGQVFSGRLDVEVERPEELLQIVRGWREQGQCTA